MSESLPLSGGAEEPAPPPNVPPRRKFNLSPNAVPFTPTTAAVGSGDENLFGPINGNRSESAPPPSVVETATPNTSTLRSSGFRSENTSSRHATSHGHVGSAFPTSPNFKWAGGEALPADPPPYPGSGRGTPVWPNVNGFSSQSRATSMEFGSPPGPNAASNTFASINSRSPTATIPPLHNFGRVFTTTTTANARRPSPSTVAIPKSPSSSCSSARSSLTNSSGIVAAQAAAFPSLPRNSTGNFSTTATGEEDDDVVVCRVFVPDHVWADRAATDQWMVLGHHHSVDGGAGYFGRDIDGEFEDDPDDPEYLMAIASYTHMQHQQEQRRHLQDRSPSVMTDLYDGSDSVARFNDGESMVGTGLGNVDDLASSLDEEEARWIEEQLMAINVLPKDDELRF